MKTKKRGFAYFYFALVAASAIMVLLSTTFHLTSQTSIITNLASSTSAFAVFLLSIAIFPILHHNSHKILYVLPTYFLFKYTIFVAVSVALLYIQNIPGLVDTILIITIILTALFELGFSGALLFRIHTLHLFEKKE